MFVACSDLLKAETKQTELISEACVGFFFFLHANMNGDSLIHWHPLRVVNNNETNTPVTHRKEIQIKSSH